MSDASGIPIHPACRLAHPGDLLRQRSRTHGPISMSPRSKRISRNAAPLRFERYRGVNGETGLHCRRDQEGSIGQQSPTIAMAQFLAAMISSPGAVQRLDDRPGAAFLSGLADQSALRGRL